MKKSLMVEKQSGEKEAFSSEKLQQSLSRSGASQQLINKVEEALRPHMYEGINTSEIYRRAFQLLRKLKRSSAARYSLKKAIMELGPSGYPFERFVGAVLEKMGYSVEVGQVVQGHCVQHEVDVVARDSKVQFMVECKYYNNQGKYCNVQVPLYIDSRFRDIEKRWKTHQANQGLAFSGWVVTNTRFTTDAMAYGKCAGLHLVSWDYPRNQSLKDMIEYSGLFPVTVLTTLNLKQKRMLLDEGVVLCRQLKEKPGVLDTLGLTRPKKQNVLGELDEVVGG
jgi:Holliday junction resolvase-like predicted endonuclease